MAVDFYIASIREGKPSVAEAALREEGFSVDTIDAFVSEIESLIRQDKKAVETLKQALNYNDEEIVDLARTVLRTYGLKE